MDTPFIEPPGNGSKLHPILTSDEQPISNCSICIETIPVGGAEVELTMLFADVRAKPVWPSMAV